MDVDYYWTKVAAQKNLPYDVNTVSNHDYFIAHRGFFWDLDVWTDEAPNDDPHQPIGIGVISGLTVFQELIFIRCKRFCYLLTFKQKINTK